MTQIEKKGKNEFAHEVKSTDNHNIHICIHLDVFMCMDIVVGTSQKGGHYYQLVINR